MRQPPASRPRWAPLLLLVALALAACVRPLAIADVKQRGEQLKGQRVTVEGEVVDRVELPLLANRYYQLDDGTGHLWVQTAQPLPARGEHVRVTGTLAPGLKVPGVEVGIVLEESTRQ
jgi:hypothetical protein